VWTRFFPASAEIRRLLSRDELGEVKLVRADFGASLMHVSRAVEKDLGGGALIDIGIYCLQFVLMVFNGEKPERTRSHPRSCKYLIMCYCNCCHILAKIIVVPLKLNHTHPNIS